MNDGRPEAALAIWRWREADKALADRRRVRQRHGVVRGAVGLVAGGALLILGQRGLAAVAGSLGSATLLLALLSPDHGYATWQHALDRFAHAIGLTLTFIVLAPLYWLVMTPFGLLLRRGARDPLHRAWAAHQASYWTVRPGGQPGDVDSAERRKRPF